MVRRRAWLGRVGCRKLPGPACRRSRTRQQGEVMTTHRRGPDLAWRPRPPGSGTRQPSSTRTQVTGFVRSSSPAAPSTGAASACSCPTRTRTCPLPLLLRAVHGALHGRVSRLTVLVALGTHARDGRGGAGRPPRLRAGRLAATYPGHDGASTTSGGSPRRSPTSARSAPRGSTSCPRAGCDLEVEVLLNRAVVEHDVALVRRPGVPARGRRDLRRQQVLLPRRRRPGDHRRLALAGRADHLARRSSAPPASPRCAR